MLPLAYVKLAKLLHSPIALFRMLLFRAPASIIRVSLIQPLNMLMKGTVGTEAQGCNDLSKSQQLIWEELLGEYANCIQD